MWVVSIPPVRSLRAWCMDSNKKYNHKSLYCNLERFKIYSFFKSLELHRICLLL